MPTLVENGLTEKFDTVWIGVWKQKKRFEWNVSSLMHVDYHRY